MQKHIFILLSFVVLFFTACDKVEDVPTTVNIAITSPIENQEFNLGDTIKVFATVTSNKNVNAYRVVFKKTAGGQVKFNSRIVNSTSFTIENFWVNDLATGGNMQLDIVADMQPSGGDPITKTVYFNCK